MGSARDPEQTNTPARTYPSLFDQNNNINNDNNNNRTVNNNNGTCQQKQEVRGLARTMKHTEVYGLRNRGTRDTIKGTLATMEAGGEDGHGIAATPAGTPPPNSENDDVSFRRKNKWWCQSRLTVADIACCCLALEGIAPIYTSRALPGARKRGVCEGRKVEHNPSLLISWFWLSLLRKAYNSFVADAAVVSCDDDGRALIANTA